ncbi:dTDP-4-dehydrorhamnose reductase [Weissella confusa]|uniref:dTDP-4-dehydrorhamnose reductase n=1 Tax=Weissella confusa TaxID=1583 RepID=UPI0018F123DB|nr:dTDP-4-dehydrorhamnose reductase [Weissella confusa]MBJ7673921.1 dTDP-4-dehydrorhamnose reductase [Weissella confusa]
MTVKYLVVGANGQLGQEIVRILQERNENFVAFNSKELDITNRKLVFSVISDENPDVILDAAAYTKVDFAEEDGKYLNWLVNAEGTKNLADAAETVGATIVYVSTDYVFEGLKLTGYLETDAVKPKTEYGRAKLAGEQAIKQNNSNYYIVRTSWVFGEFGNNFVHTMLKLGDKLDEINVVNDQKGRPTWTKTLANFLLHLVDSDSEFGVYNLSNDNEATWYEFAVEILKEKNVKVNPVKSSEFPTVAKRPKNSVLSLEKAKSTGFTIPTWQEALNEYLSR